MSDFIFQKRDVRKSAGFNKFFKCAIVGLSLWSGASLAQSTQVEAQLEEQVMMIPARSGQTLVELETTIYKPPGDGPFPLVVMNHGKERGDPKYQRRDRFLVLSKEFVKRGYAVVIPMRRGFSKSTGGYLEDGCNMTNNGRLQANDLQGSLEYFTQQPWVDKNRIIVAGQSYGGLTTMAFGTHGFPGVKGLINFAGGLRVDGGSCNWQGALVTAFAEYGSKNTLPSLWFYGQNDSFFNHDVATRLHNAYVTAGGNAKLVAYGPFKSDAHGMVSSRDGVKIWWPETEMFLRQIGMPTEEVVAIADKPRMPRTNYAAIDNVDAIPYLKDSGREAYRVFLSKSLPRAFAVSPTGEWSWAEEGDDPIERVLAGCQASSGQSCKLYAVDDYVVWSDNPATPPRNNAASGN
jgi:dienelactone hydrolase